MRTINERLDEILPKITDPSFKENKGLGNEVGYHIFDYDPEQEMIVRKHIEFIKKHLNSGASNQVIKEFDLYEMVLEILDQKGYLEKNFTLEERRGSEYVLNATRKSLRLTLDNDLMIKYIADRIQDHEIIFITGVGKVFPIVRSHVVLNNLFKAVGQVPVVMFFPGRYDGQELRLFGEIKDDNYYRAFQLVEY